MTGSFPVGVRVQAATIMEDLGRAEKHLLDTVFLTVHERNWRAVVEAMEWVWDQGWGLSFVLWAPGKRVKNVPIQRFAGHPKLLGWVVENLSDPVVIARLRATTGQGTLLSWRRKERFTKGLLSPDPPLDIGGIWWAWVTVKEPERVWEEVQRALLKEAGGICFSYLPGETELAERERLKALGSFSVQLRLWQPLLQKRSEEIPTIAGGAECQGWRLIGGEWLIYLVPESDRPLWLRLPFPVPEGVRAYALRLPALKRLPLQRKGDETVIKVRFPDGTGEMVWVTGRGEGVERMHRHVMGLLPKAMEFAVQWALARRERAKRSGITLTEWEQTVWHMLQAAKRRQFRSGYMLAREILQAYGKAMREEGERDDEGFVSARQG